MKGRDMKAIAIRVVVDIIISVASSMVIETIKERRLMNAIKTELGLDRSYFEL